ncbi:MAG: hypothetical protein Fur0011_5880 [Candidatus Microgenomates bacterium]
MLKFALACVGVILAWSLTTPIFEFPDEQAHYGSVDYLLTQGEMPSYGKNDLNLEMLKTQEYLGTFRDGLGNNRYTYHPEYHVEYSDSLLGKYESDILNLNNSEYRNNYVGTEAAKYPPLYYRLASIYTWFVNSSDLITRVFVARLASLDLAILMAIVAWKIGELVFYKNNYVKVFVLMVMLQPMYSFVTAGINSDNLHNLLFMSLIYGCLRLLKTGPSPINLGILSLSIILDIYTKPQGFIGIPLAITAVLLYAIMHKKWSAILYSLLGILLVLVLGSSQWEKYGHLLAVVNNHGVGFFDYLRYSVGKLVAQNVVWYWGVFKWLGVVLPPIYWQVANRAVILSIVGMLYYGWKVLKHKKIIADPVQILFMIMASVIYALAIFWYDWQHTKINGYSLGIQARYFFPTMTAHLALMLTGLTTFGWSTLSRIWIRNGIVLLFVWLQLGALVRLITIYYPANNFIELVKQMSQYKPFYAKGDWWYLWFAIYLCSIIYLIRNALVVGKKAVVKRRQK